MAFLVTEAAQRPLGMDGTCFYCRQPIGAEHKDDCVLIKKTVKVRLTIEYDVDVPSHWDAHSVEFHRNGSGWCADNLVRELQNLAEREGCLCSVAHFDYLADTSGLTLEEQ